MQLRFLTLLFLAAASAHAATPRACDLVTSQQAAPFMAGKSLAGSESDTGPQHTCIFSDPNQPRRFVVNIEATDVFGGPGVLKQVMMAPAEPGNTKESLSGLGDFAMYNINLPGGTSIALLYHGYLVTLEVTDRTVVPGMKAPLIQIAKQVMAKL